MKVALYVQLVPERSSYNPDVVHGIRTVKVTRRRPKPERMVPDAQLVKIELDVPMSTFLIRTVEVAPAEVRPITVVRSA